MDLLKTMEDRILIGDGAMGTLLYSHGVDFCFEKLNVTNPDEILSVHQAYVEAGANVIQTNSYGANSIKLARYGLEDKVRKINKKAVQLARQVATENTFVVGTIGGINGNQNDLAEIKSSFREQLYGLLLEGVDGLLLETFYNLNELTTVLAIAREETQLPIITNVSMHEPGVLENGIALEEALKQLGSLGADVVGINCRLGPRHMVQSLESVPLPSRAFLSAYPNASLPAYQEGKLVYNNQPEYFESCAVDFRNQGVRLIGGCCGTTPDHIRALKKGVEKLTPLREKKVVPKQQAILVNGDKKANNGGLLTHFSRENHSVIVELDPPKHLLVEEYLDGVHALNEVGVDAITLADNSLASPRISNIAIASLIKQQNIRAKALVHLTCRDRNLIGLQSHLMGLHTLGFHDILAITGDPTKIGDFPGATSVFDITSFELIRLIKQCNNGVSFSGKSLKQPTHFRVAAAFNPNVAHLEKAVKRLERKIEYGADYFLTQPIFSVEKIEELYHATKHINTPIYIGIMPLTSSNNAEFLHNEVPGMKLTDDVRARMHAASDRAKSIREGIVISKELIDTAIHYFHGVYLITPFMKYEITVELAAYIKKKKSKQVVH
ncbi:bifunctional homocysteine S-methyltransferase/methylenetetrahydrofolate reductase [Radiobacillus kanasensis]|uniref:bifunctional homocysteine S-methyltransferase/methylenetetrahydrofolate reductase n=1 Tax=Radiobacillus kanasensis TaxID=2844358 RepID=UPI001E60044C|nr:bifunctional homocysteine S-methyltransferase/methylenetetrahydrofolate reductase [Radiobacillus kanasensis]UFT99958.1 bifunctional homocysteine S-methyltransferase/methylenetetrahydrofolate reductase [Radiobacillus kanasensis]